jgi:hypothetical protein
MIIWGSKGRFVTIGEGSFFCPSCEAVRRYKHQQAGRYFTLYFIPLFKTKSLGDFVECQTCKMTFKPEVLTLSKELEEQRRLQKELKGAIAAITSELDSGVPIEAVAKSLMDSGVDQEGAARIVYGASGGQIRSCTACNLNYKSSVAYCSVCGQPLAGVVSY